MMDYNAYRQEQMRKMNGAVMSDRDRQMFNNNMPYNYAQQYRQELTGGAMSDRDRQVMLNQFNQQLSNTPMSTKERQTMYNTMYNNNQPIGDYNTYRQRRMHELAGAAMTDRERQDLDSRLKEEYRKEFIRQNGGVLTEKDLKQLNKMLNPNSFEMPTYQEIYNNLTSLLGF